MAGPGQRDELARIGRWFDGHPVGPGLGVVGVLDQERQRRSERLPMPHAGKDPRLLRLDGHPAAASVSELATLQVALDVLPQQVEAGGKPVEDPDQGRPMRFAGGEEAEPRHASAAFRSSAASSPRWGLPSQISSDAMA